MIKNSQNIIKKGDYYLYEPAQQIIPSQSKAKRDQTPIISSTNIPVSEYINTQIPNFKQARNKYFFHQLSKQYQNKNIHQLKSELYEMLNVNEQIIKDEDRKQIEKLIEEIDGWKDKKEIPLVELKIKNDKKMNIDVKKTLAENLTINITSKYNLVELQHKVSKLQSLDFPQLQNLQHQLQIMIGQKKPLPPLQPLPKDYPKDQINNIYNHLNSMQILKSINLTIDKITLNEQKHAEMKNWVEKHQKITTLNHDIFTELKEDQLLLNKLESNFKKNIQQVREIINELKK